ncbi:MAG TPA: MBL fold metallo-hydrolase [Patescibacteria group bacterium]|nr:MBL fold metallo-hydrolase [Patescibacteria group bacterium]
MNKLLILLTLTTITVWFSIFTFDSNLHVVACDVGQGDAILIQKNNNQILIDGGPNSRVLDCLGRFIPFWDKTIELVILTHPQEDHYGGLIDVFKNYKVEKFGQYNTKSSNQSYQVLEKMVGSRGVEGIILHQGIVVRLGMIYLDVLNPPEGMQDKNENNNGIVTLLKYGQFKALFMADVEDSTSNKISESIEIQNIDYIKVNHHGSKNGLTKNLLDVIKPKVAIISVGKNSYGHPDSTIIEMLKNVDAKILRTDELGNIELITDGAGQFTTNH